MLNIKNFYDLKGDYIECAGYTLSIDSICGFSEQYAITVSLKKRKWQNRRLYWI